MTQQLKLETVKEAYKNLTTSLKDHSGKPEIISESLEEALSISFLDDAKVNIAGKASVDLFNSKDDEDESDIIGLRSDTVDEFALGSAITYSSENCWLKYSVEASIKGSSSKSTDELGIGIDSKAGILLRAYKVHNPDTALGEAVINDLEAMPLIFDVADVLDLQANEALALETKGKLNVALEFSWSDIIAQNISRLSRWLDQGEILNLDFGADLTAKINVSIEDFYKVTFSRDPAHPGSIRLGVHKSRIRGGEIGVQAKISAGLSNPDDFKVAYNAIVESIFEQPKDKLEKIKSLVDTSGLDDSIQSVVDRLSDRLGIDESLDKVERVQKKIREIETDLKDIIETAAKMKASISLSYEYGRLNNKDALLQVLIRNDRLPECHSAAISNNFSTITNLIDNESIVLERFFFQKSTRITHSWGFNLGFGSWKAMSNRFSEIEFVENRDQLGRRRLSTFGLRGYKEDMSNEKRMFFVDFDAEMGEYSQYSEPKVTEFDMALTVSHVTEDPLLSDEEIVAIADDATVWELAPTGEVEEAGGAYEILSKVFEGATDVKIVRTVTIRPAGFQKLLPLLSTFDMNQMAISLSAALPYDEFRKSGRGTPDKRISLYSPLWKLYLEGAVIDPDSLARIANHELSKRGYRRVGRWEKNWLNEAAKSRTFAGVLANHRGVAEDLKNFSLGMERLLTAYQEGRSHKEIAKAYRMFDNLGAHNFYVRFLGHYLINRARLISSVSESFEYSMKIEYSKAGAKRELVWGRA